MDNALRQIASLTKDGQNSGMLRLAYEATLAWSEIQIKAGNTAEGRTRLAALQKEALGKGYLLIARKAAKSQ